MTDDKKDDAAKEGAAKKGPNPDLVTMQKEAQKIRVHKSCVADHEARGWRKA